MPAFSSGQWAGTLADDLCGDARARISCSCAAAASSRIPTGPRPASRACSPAWEAVQRRRDARSDARTRAGELQRALEFFGRARKRPRIVPRTLRIAYYGDDFTGATDTLATATQGGLAHAAVPARSDAGDACAPRASSTASASRARRARWRPPTWRPSCARSRECFATLGAPVVALQDLLDLRQRAGRSATSRRRSASCRTRIPSRFIPIVGGQPNIGRYCAVRPSVRRRGGRRAGACASTGTRRARHPVTPMTESDLRLHLARQGLTGVALGAVPGLRGVAGRLDRDRRAGSATAMRCCST